MQATVNAKQFNYVFKDFIKNGKTMVNFKVISSTMEIQILNDYTVCYTCPINLMRSDEFNEISFWVDKTITILTDDTPIMLAIDSSSITISQGTFTTTLLREYEERREFVPITDLELKLAYAKRLKYLTGCVVQCMPLSKELGFADPDPIFSGNKFYADYQQTFLIEHMQFPECCLTLQMMRDVIYKLEEDAEYAYLPEHSLLYFKSGFYNFWIPTVNYNIDLATITAVEKKLMDLQPVTTICIKPYVARMQVLTSVFPKKRFTLTIGEHTFAVSITSNTTYTSIGDTTSEYKLSKNLTTAQLEVIIRLFKDEDEIEILRGGNCLCLRSKEKSLLIAGLLY